MEGHVTGEVRSNSVWITIPLPLPLEVVGKMLTAFGEAFPSSTLHDPGVDEEGKPIQAILMELEW